jgi:hypothetical protein
MLVARLFQTLSQSLSLRLARNPKEQSENTIEQHVKVSPTIWARMVKRRRTWSLELTPEDIRINRGTDLFCSVPLSNVRAVRSADGLLGASVTLTTSKINAKYNGLVPGEVGRFVEAVRRRGGPSVTV